MHWRDAVNIEDLRSIAQRRLPRFVFSYIDGGSEDELSLAGNREAYRRLRFRPRTLVASDRHLARFLKYVRQFPRAVPPGA